MLEGSATATNISDVRGPDEFRTSTFSGHKRTAVRKELVAGISGGHVESACHWSAEMLCSGHGCDLWGAIVSSASTTIHCGNPRLSIYLARRFDEFKGLVSGVYAQNELRLRNNPRVRVLVGEMMAVLCSSRKRHPFEKVKFDGDLAFDIADIEARLSAPTMEYAETVFKEDDPKEIFVSINELAYCLSQPCADAPGACYWIEWILHMDKARRLEKNPLIAVRRNQGSVAEKYETDAVWLAWEALVHAAGTRESPLLASAVQALVRLFSIRFTPSCKVQRRFVLYWAVSLVCYGADWTEPLVRRPAVIEQVTRNINAVYAEIKVNEVPPSTSYLEGAEGPTSFDRTADRLEQLDSLMETGVPRLPYTKVEE